MRLTKKEALLRCKAMWQWLADHPDATDKADAINTLWPDLEFTPLNQCWACEYAKKKNSFGEILPTCTKCPLWPAKGFKYGSEEAPWYGCEKAGSPYVLWVNFHSPEKRIKGATDIVALCDAALEKLK